MVTIKLKASRSIEAQDDGVLYILYMWHEDSLVVKVGVTKRDVTDRVVEILLSYFHKYRVFPKLYPKRFRQTDRVYKKEAMMHKYFEDKAYKFDKPFSGSTEYFVGIEEDELLIVYEDCLRGVDINADDYQYCKS